MVSKDGEINLVVACEQERLLQWLLSAIDDGERHIVECCAGQCDHSERDQCVDHLLAVYNEESNATAEAKQKTSAPCGHDVSESKCLGILPWGSDIV